ncbi:MIF4G domain-containing protein / MA3 domain-containing protein [Tasmannia lanceolata]|uniref:MIF4G domain-containing protein / MA3 domain-containing protein n=1 Tax=Tasmannia lanceolata TaxID=3420 RepID=UPI004064076C
MEKKRVNLKRKKKTKFEEYLEWDMNRSGVVSGEVDLELERKLAKKLNVKKGKLGDLDDGLNLLFDDMDFDDIINDGNSEAPMEITEFCSLKRKVKKKKVLDEAEKEELEDETEKKHKKRKQGMLEKKGEDEVMGNLSKEEAGVGAPPSDGNVTYVAPHLRPSVGKESEEHSQIRRRVRGLLNKLSESNVESITEEISTIFRSVGRSIGCQIIGEEVLTSCSGGPRGNEQYAAVFAAFIAGMVCLVGIDFSAKLIASLAKSFEDEYLKEDGLSLRNLTLLLSYLCIFGVCSSDLIYDFLFGLSKRLTELDVSTILTLLQCCGMKLRSDDPAAMKDFIINVQNRVNESKSLSGHIQDGQQKKYNKRMEFMLETICDIKNNKKRLKEDPAHHTRLKKWLQKLRVGDVLLRGLKWSKLLDPHKKGQWWISGDITSTTDNAEEVATTIDKEVLEAQKLLKLAATQRMNTDTRRAIFCIIMSGEDYIDAFEKITRLDLPGKQDREIMRVLVECCLQEKVFNKYYTVLASRLCSHDKNHKFTLQYCLWDHFKELGSMELIRSMNLARFTAEMLASFSLSPAILKTVDLSDPKLLTPKRIMHFRMLFEAIFEKTNMIIWNVFTRIAIAPELELLRDSLKFFMTQYVASANKSSVRKFEIAKKALGNVAGILM